ncbi:hypothetical protein P3S67_020576 [Capsicum chacoense]
MAMKVVVVVFVAMLVMTEHNAMASSITCLIGCGPLKSIVAPEAYFKCVIECGKPCTIQCLVDSKKPVDIPNCLLGCFSPFVTEQLETPNRATTTVCTVGCSLGICSQFHNDEEMFGACMKNCASNHCTIGGNIALEKA